MRSQTRQLAVLLAALILATTLHDRTFGQSALQQPAPPGQPGAARPGAARPGAPTRGPAAEGKRREGRIRGRVMAADGGPVRRASVRLLAEPNIQRGTTADAEGRFEFAELDAGAYDLSASKTGFVTAWYGQRKPNERGRRIDLAEGEQFDRAAIVLDRGAVVIGRVIDEFGDPVSDVTVSAMRFAYPDGEKRLVPAGRGANTDDIGQFRLFGLQAGEYYLSAIVRAGGFISAPTADAAGYAPTYFPSTANPNEAQPIVVRKGEERPVGDLQLVASRIARVTGTVLNSSGKPAEGGYVMLQNAGANMGFLPGASRGGEVKPDGTFIISNVSPGDYVLQAMPDDGDEQGEFGSMKVTVGGEDLQGLMVLTTRGATLRGRIAIEPHQEPPFRPGDVGLDVRKASEPRYYSPMGRSKVNEDWTFFVEGVTGENVLRLYGLPQGWTVKSATLDGRDILDTPFAVRGTEEITDVDVVLTSRSAQITGTVSDDRNRVVKDFAVLAFPADSTRWQPWSRYLATGRPDQNGGFKLVGLPAGDYLVVALESIAPGKQNSADFLESMRGVATRVTLGEGDASSVQLKIRPEP